MRILIAYYSRTGKTEKLAETIESEFKNRGHEVDVEKIKPVKERSFFGWFFLRIFKDACPIEEPRIKDVSRYDAVCVGSPNWSRVALPMAQYLKEVDGLKYKNVGLFSTAKLWPAIEWALFSAYLLETSFSNLVEEKGGRSITTILLSSLFGHWGIKSNYGRREIVKFCYAIETPILSYKEYILFQKETKEIRFLIALFSAILSFILLGKAISQYFGLMFLSWQQALILSGFYLTSVFALLARLSSREKLHRAKYLAMTCLLATWILTVIFARPAINSEMVLGCVILLMLTTFFRHPRVTFFSGAVVIAEYFGFRFFLSPAGQAQIIADIFFLLFGVGIAAVISRKIKTYFISLLELQDEIETIRATYGIRVNARTRELNDIVRSLDEQVMERTLELREKVETLEKINRIAIDRELKMIQLKEEITKLKEQVNSKQLGQ